jgi:hypothetical protein
MPFTMRVLTRWMCRWLLILGRYAAPDEALPQALATLRTLRGGGTPLSDDEAVALLESGGLTNVRSVPSDRGAPIRSVAGQRAAWTS